MGARRLARKLARVTVTAGGGAAFTGGAGAGGAYVCGLGCSRRSVVACAIDDVAGEIQTLRVSPKTEAIVAWVRALPGPVAVAYEAGPTGFGLARALAVAGVRCEGGGALEVGASAGRSGQDRPP